MLHWCGNHVGTFHKPEVNLIFLLSQNVQSDTFVMLTEGLFSLVSCCSRTLLSLVFDIFRCFGIIREFDECSRKHLV